MRTVHEAVRKVLPKLRAQHGGTVFSADGFRALVAVAREVSLRVVGR